MKTVKMIPANSPKFRPDGDSKHKGVALYIRTDSEHYDETLNRLSGYAYDNFGHFPKEVFRDMDDDSPSDTLLGFEYMLGLMHTGKFNLIITPDEDHFLDTSEQLRRLQLAMKMFHGKVIFEKQNKLL